MSKLVLKNAKFLLNAVDLSAEVQSVGIVYSAAALDNTAMGQNTKTNLGGLFDWPVSLELYQDYGASLVDATLFPIVGTVVAVEIRPDAGARSATNPGFTGNVLVESYEPVSGQVGQMAMTKVSLKPAGDLARQTS